MFRNQYDTDVTVWSPEGRLLQVSNDTLTYGPSFQWQQQVRSSLIQISAR